MSERRPARRSRRARARAGMPPPRRHCRPARAWGLRGAPAPADLGRLRDGDALSVPGLRALGSQERINTLRLWLLDAGVEPPSEARLTEALRQIFEAEADHLPAIEWGGWALRRYRKRVFLTQSHPPRLESTLRWSAAPGARLDLGPELGALRWVAQTGGIEAGRLPDTLRGGGRAGGEALKPGFQGQTRSA